MPKRAVRAAAVAGGVTLLAGAVLLTGTASHRGTTSWIASTSGGGHSSANVQTVDYPYPADVPDQGGPGLELAGPVKPDGSGAGALVVLAPHQFSFGVYGDRYPGAVKTKNLALSMDQAGILSLVGDRGPMWSTETRAPNGHAVFQTDGNLVVYDRDDQPVWASGTDGNPRGNAGTPGRPEPGDLRQ